MAQQTINIGAVANDGTGDPLRTAFDKVNDNFDELFAGGSSVETRNNFTGDGTTTGFTLTVAPSSANSVDIYIDGVYQNKNTYTITGTALSFSEAPPNNTDVEVMIISGLALVVNDITNYGVNVISTSTTASKNNIYVLTSDLTLTLPISPATGDSVKISNLSGDVNCVIARNGENIMGVAQDLTLDTASASFELVFSSSSNGWVIIGL